MKKKVIFAISLILVMVVTACSSATPASSNDDSGVSAQNGVNNGSETASGTLSEEFNNALPISAQLGFGTLMLEDTELAVTPTQAAELLPLWKAARSLSDSETISEAELEAIFKQIQDAMTPEQLAAINEMEFGSEQMAQLAEDLGISFGFGGEGFGNLTPEQQATAQAARESGQGFSGGGFPGGGFPGGGIPGGEGPVVVQGGEGPGGFQGGSQLSPEQLATLEARRAERGGSGARFSLVFVDPLIDLLEERAAE